ncbi:MAG: indolepyruvate ferredoxin oxidoreductase subunit alpha [archaeon]
MLLTGNSAIARGAYEAGVILATGYPGTPASEVVEAAAELGIESQWSANEKVALEVAFGASYGGARAISAMKNAGLNVASDPLLAISYTGVNAGLVIVVADDPGPHSSQNEQDSRHYAMLAKVPMLEPSDSSEALALTVMAYNLSEKYDTPVLLRTTMRVAHSMSIVKQGSRTETKKEVRPDMHKYVLLPYHAKMRHLFVEDRLQRLEAHSENLNSCEFRGKGMGIITSGVCYQYVREAFPEASVMKLNMTYPLSCRQVKAFAAEVKKLYVVEELDPFIENQVRVMGLDPQGKSLFPRTGELNPAIVGSLGSGKKMDLITEHPSLCRGCHYHQVFRALRKTGAAVIGDVGCYTLGALPPHNCLQVQLNMGLSIGCLSGFEKANPAKPAIALIGDSTFIHSGISSIINSRYTGSISTVVILKNGVAAMTGGQPYPGSDSRRGIPQIDLVRLLNALDIVTDMITPDRVEQTIMRHMSLKQMSAIIVDAPCKRPAYLSRG